MLVGIMFFDNSFHASFTTEIIRMQSTFTEQLTIFHERIKGRKVDVCPVTEAENEVHARFGFLVFLLQLSSQLLIQEMSADSLRHLGTSCLSSFCLVPLKFIPGNYHVCTAGMLSCFFRRDRLSIVTGLLQNHLIVLRSQPLFISICIPPLPLTLQFSYPLSNCSSINNDRMCSLQAEPQQWLNISFIF